MSEHPADVIDEPDGISNVIGAAGSHMIRLVSVGAAKGAKFTRRAVQSLPNPLARIDLERLTSRVPKVRLSERTARLAKLFRNHDTSSGDAVLREEVSSEDDADYCTEDQLRERVDRKYFDSQFDAQKAEMTALASMANPDLTALEQAQKQRDDQIRAVNGVLKKKMLDNYHVFTGAVCRIREVNDDLLHIAVDCRTGRERLAITRHSFVENGLRIPREKRRRDNLRTLLRHLEAVASAKKRNEHLANLYESHRFRELTELTAGDFLPAEQLRLIEGLRPTEDYKANWARIANDPDYLMRDAEDKLDKCLTRRFDLSAYLGATDAFGCFNQKQSVKAVSSRLIAAGGDIVFRTLSDASSVQRGELTAVASGVPPESLALTACAMCAKVLEFVTIFSAVIEAHDAIVKKNDPARSRDEIQFHAELKVAIESNAPQVGELLRSQLIDVAACFEFKDPTTALHTFYLISLAVESTMELKDPKKTIPTTRSMLKNIVREWVSRHVVVSRALQMLEAMEADTWQSDGTVIPQQFLLVTSLSPDKFKEDVRKVRGYAKQHIVGGSNPFYDIAMPQDLSSFSTAYFTPVEPFTVVTQSAALLSNAAFELCGRIVPRFPQLATEVATWLEQLLALFVYTVGGSFVSSSRSIKLEDQLDFNPTARDVMREMRDLCFECIPELEQIDFPAPVFTKIGARFSSPQGLFAVAERLTAIASNVTMVDYCVEMVKSLGPLIAKDLLQEQVARIRRLRGTVLHMLHIGAHRLALALIPLEQIGEDIAKPATWAHREGLSPGKYVDLLGRYVDTLHELVSTSVRFPTPYLEKTFWRHVSFAVQATLVSSFASVKRRTDLTVTQMSVDSQAIHEKMSRIVVAGDRIVVNEKYVSNFLRALFSKSESRWDWAHQSAAEYRRSDVLQILSEDNTGATRDKVLSVLNEWGCIDDHIRVEHIERLDG